MQYVKGKAKRAIQVLSTNKNGSILALKRLKYMFGLAKHTYPSLQKESQYQMMMINLY